MDVENSVVNTTTRAIKRKVERWCSGAHVGGKFAFSSYRIRCGASTKDNYVKELSHVTAVLRKSLSIARQLSNCKLLRTAT